MADRNQKKPKQQKKKSEDKDRIDSMVDAGSGFTQNH